MERVPLAFCESVIACFEKPSSIVQPLLSSALWQTAIVREAENRLHIDLNIGFNNGNWSAAFYKLLPHRQSRKLTFEDLQKLDRRNIRLYKLTVCKLSFTEQWSFEEILKIVTFTLPCVSMTVLSLSHIYTYPTNDLLQLLTLYRNSPIYSLYSWENIHQVDDFTTNLLRSNMLRSVGLHGANVSDTFRAQLEDFALYKPFQSIKLESKDFKFSQSFFENLFAKPLCGAFQECSFTSHFDFSLADLKDFRPELQINGLTEKVQWKREDGVVVEAKMYCYGIIKLTFTR